ncbi:MAG: YajQ family cyclic di-GMP-binding protein [Steroidobacteraceae bacterium]
MPSFDVVSELNAHEVANAVDQANRELAQRFDFKDQGASFALEDFVVTLRARVEFQLKQMLDILRVRLGKRGIDVTCMEIKDAEVNLAEARQAVALRHGIDQESGRKIQKILKEADLKVQAGIQGDKVRVTGKQRDELQAAIALLRKSGLGLPLQFENFRD